MDANEQRLDRVRVIVIWVITAVWAGCFPLAVWIKDFPITWAQAPMMIVVGWLFAVPLIRRNDNGGEK